MNPINLLAMQAGTAQNFGTVGHCTTPPEIDPHIAAAMAGGMRRVHWIACRWAWSNDYRLVNELRQRLFDAALPIAKREKWPKLADNLERLADLALVEISQLRSDPKIPAIKTHPDRYRYLGWHKMQWSRWKKRYESVYDIVERWEGEGRRHLRIAQIEKL